MNDYEESLEYWNDYDAAMIVDELKTIDLKQPLRYFKTTETASDPVYGTPGSHCFDVALDCKDREYKEWDEEGHKNTLWSTDYVTISPKTRVMLGTGLIFELDPNTVMKMYLRSSIGYKTGLTMAHHVGIIDSDYRGELFVCLRNDNEYPITLNHGDRIAQCEVQNSRQMRLEPIDTKPELVEGRNGGIGSTGK